MFDVGQRHRSRRQQQRELVDFLLRSKEITLDLTGKKVQRGTLGTQALPGQATVYPGRQLRAVDRLQAKDFDRTLLSFVEQILAAQRFGSPHVAFDFWQQFDSLEQLEEIRRYRPSAFMALPEGPA